MHLFIHQHLAAPIIARERTKERLIKNSSVILLLILVCATTYAQTFSFDPSILSVVPIGPRAAAMGRAFVAIADDATALAWNPAGLARVEENRAAISGTLNFGNIDPTLPSGTNSDFNFDVKQGSSAGLNYIGFTIPIPLQPREFTVVSSIAMRNICDFGDKVTYKRFNQKTNTQTDDLFENNGGLFSLSGGLGVAVFDNLQVGGSLNLLSGKCERGYEQYKIDADTSLLIGKETIKNKFSGLLIETGFIWRINPAIAVGSTIQFPHTIHYDQIRMIDSNDDERELDAEIFAQIPMRYTIGLSVMMSKTLTFAFDYGRRPWNNVRLNIDDLQQDRYFRDSNSFHMGVEYIAGGEEVQVPLRFGFFNQPEQLFEFDPLRTDQRGDQISSHSITGGIGLHFSQIYFDLSMQYRFYQYEDDIFSAGDQQLQINVDKFSLMGGLEFAL